MQTLLKIPGLLLLVLLTYGIAQAQPVLRKPDVIQKMDKTSLEVVVDEINKTEILYRKANDPKGPLYAIPKKDVSKIIWNNGDVEEINVAAAVAQKPVKPTDLLVKPDKRGLLFRDNKGLFAGLRAGAGIGMLTPPTTKMLKTGSKPAYNLGVTAGYRFKSLSIQADALYTAFSFDMNLPGSISGVTDIEGHQANLVIPLTATVYTRIAKTRVGFSIGGLGAVQLGTGSTKVNFSDQRPSVNSKNCADCTDKLTYGVTGGITAVILEGPNHSVFIDARWNQSLKNNSEYKNIAESGVKMNTGMLGAGVLFNLSH